jgi:hypothetical protein
LEVLRSDHGEQLEFVVALAARHGGVDQEPVRLPRIQECLTVERQDAELRMDEALDVVEAGSDVVFVPQARELAAFGEQQLREASRL